MASKADALRAVAEVLDAAGIVWWLSDGAALGAVRDGRLLDSDGDVDVGVWAADHERVRDTLAARWQLRRDRPTQVWALVDGVKVDVHMHRSELGRVYYVLGEKGEYRYEFPGRLFETFGQVTVHGVTARVPAPAGDYLTAHYGPDWRTPRAVWRWDADPPCLTRSPREKGGTLAASVSVVVMAHEKRAHFIPELLNRLDRPATVVWDERNDRWDTGRRAWMAVDRNATHGLVIQDDAIPCRDLAAGVERALAFVPPESPLGLYVGRARPYRQLVEKLVSDTDETTSWLMMTKLHWGVGIVIPVALIDQALAWCDRLTEVDDYDRRLSRWFERERIPVYYPWPSLVEHRDSPSLVPGRTGKRHAYLFLGADKSASDVDWAGRVVTIPALSAPPPPVPPGKVPVRFVSTRYPNLHLPHYGVRFRDGVAEVTSPRAIAKLLTMGRYGVRLDDTQSTGPGLAPAQEPKAEARKSMPPIPVPPQPDPVVPEPETSAEAASAVLVPSGTTAEVIAWVGEDPTRARAALEAEQARQRPRVTLVAALHRILHALQGGEDVKGR